MSGCVWYAVASALGSTCADNYVLAVAGVDVRAAGLATHYIPSHLLPEVESRLQRLAGSHAAHIRRPMDLSEINRLLCEIEEHAGPLPRGKLTEQLPWINQHFSNHSVGDILQSLSRRQAQLSALDQTVVEAAWLENTLKALGRCEQFQLQLCGMSEWWRMALTHCLCFVADGR